MTAVTPRYPHSTGAVQASPFSHPAGLGVASGCEIQHEDFLLGIPRPCPGVAFECQRAARGQARSAPPTAPGAKPRVPESAGAGEGWGSGKAGGSDRPGALPLPSPRLSPCAQHKTPGSSPLIARRAANTFPRGSTPDTTARAG